MPLGRSIEATDRAAAPNEPRIVEAVDRDAERRRHLTSVVAGVAALAAGFDLTLAVGATVALPVAVLLAPVLLPSVREHSMATLLLLLGAAAMTWGVVLGEANLAERAVSGPNRLQLIGLVASGLAAMVILLWARRHLPTWAVAALYGTGGLFGAVVQGSMSWKFSLAAPATIVVVGLLERRSRLAAAAGLLGMGVVTLLDDGRAFLGFCVLAAVITMWQSRPPLGWTRRWQPAVMLAVLAVALYQLAVVLLSGGYLGSEAQERTIDQIETSGSLLTGGRPEWAATAELVRRDPTGFGLGAIPTWDDVRAARGGLATVEVELERNRLAYMFGGQFRLHSVAGDLWAGAGLVGLALAGLIAVALVRSLSFAIADRAAPAVVCLAVVMGLWHLLFGPIYSNWHDVCAALGLVLLHRPAVTSGLVDHGR